MVEADEAMTGALDLLHAQVEPFGRSVRGSRSMVVEDLWPPALQGVAERSDLGHLVGKTAGDRFVQQHGGDSRIVGEIDVAH